MLGLWWQSFFILSSDLKQFWHRKEQLDSLLCVHPHLHMYPWWLQLCGQRSGLDELTSPHLCAVILPATAPLPPPHLTLLSAARLLPHFNPDASAPLAGQTPSPEDDTIIRDLLPENAGVDHQTVHQLIMVLMKFMAKDQSSAEADIGSAKAFNTVKRHLYVLLGYDQQEGCFMIAPQKMRTSTCFNAFIAGIAQVTDI